MGFYTTQKSMRRGLSGMTQCIDQLSFGNLHGKQITATFDGGNVSTDGGVLLVTEADRKLGLTETLGGSLRDARQAAKVSHPFADMLAQRVYQIARGYEDCNDADDLRYDPMFKTAIGRLPESGSALASQPTLSRFENSISRTQLLRLAHALADRVLDEYAGRTPERIILDFDGTDDPTHGQQQLTGFNGFYDEHCYLPLIVTARIDDGPDELLVAMLRPGKIHAAENALPVLKRLVAKLRERWPEVKIVFRADNGFGKPEIYDWCEDNKLGYLISLAQNSRLLAIAEPWMERARAEYEKTGEKARHLHETRYAAKEWRSERRVVVKAEVMAEGDNPRFVVTNLVGGTAEDLYDEYSMRGEQENRIKELKNDLQIDRTSCHRFVANQFRVLLHATAFVLLSHLRKHLTGTELARVQVCTLQRHLLKLGVRVRETAPKVWLHFASNCPAQDLWPELLSRMRAAPA